MHLTLCTSLYALHSMHLTPCASVYCWVRGLRAEEPFAMLSGKWLHRRGARTTNIAGANERVNKVSARLNEADFWALKVS